MQTVLFYLHSAAVLIFGVFLSAAFSGIKLSVKNSLYILSYCLLSGILQMALYSQFSEQTVWYVYPLIVHLPTVLYLWFGFRKRFFSALAAVLISYLFCQPAKWMGVLTFQLTQSASLEYAARLVCLLGVGFLSLKFAAPSFVGILSKKNRSIAIFSIIPIVYYLFDYTMVVYADLWNPNDTATTEFVPMLLSLSFMVFCMVYYREYEQKADAERKEQMVQLIAQQQANHMENVKQLEQNLRMERHDMRHFLNRLAICINRDDSLKAKEMLQDYITHIDGMQLTRFCGCETVNYVLSAFATQCQQANIKLHCDVCLDELKQDELLFCSILQNALENAFHAQLLLDEEKRSIQLLLKYMDEKLLLSIKNPTNEVPVFVDGLPISKSPDHGYGTQSIHYLSERLHGSCQFSCHDGLFVLRVVL